MRVFGSMLLVNQPTPTLSPSLGSFMSFEGAQPIKKSVELGRDVGSNLPPPPPLPKGTRKRDVTHLLMVLKEGVPVPVMGVNLIFG